MMIRSAACALAGALALPAFILPAVAQDGLSGSYAFDPQHSHIVWSYDHLGYSHSTGMVRGLQGQVTLDAADPSKSSVEAQFPLSALTTVTPDLDTHLRSADFFDDPDGATLITFRSTSVAPEGDDEARVTGDLTINGVTRPVLLEVELRKAAPNPMTEQPTVGFKAETEIKRSDFGLGAFAPAVSDELSIDIHVEAIRAQ